MRINHEELQTLERLSSALGEIKKPFLDPRYQDPKELTSYQNDRSQFELTLKGLINLAGECVPRYTNHKELLSRVEDATDEYGKRTKEDDGIKTVYSSWMNFNFIVTELAPALSRVLRNPLAHHNSDKAASAEQALSSLTVLGQEVPESVTRILSSRSYEVPVFSERGSDSGYLKASTTKLPVLARSFAVLLTDLASELDKIDVTKWQSGLHQRLVVGTHTESVPTTYNGSPWSSEVYEVREEGYDYEANTYENFYKAGSEVKQDMIKALTEKAKAFEALATNLEAAKGLLSVHERK